MEAVDQDVFLQNGEYFTGRKLYLGHDALQESKWAAT